MNSTAISRKHTTLSLLRFSIPTVIMMIFMSLYTMVDGIFVSRIIGTQALSAVNIVFPVQSIVIAIGVMFATGGCAVVARQMGEGKGTQARSSFSLIALTGGILGFAMLVIGLIFLRPIISLLGGGQIFELCKAYLLPLLFFTPAGILQMIFQSFFVAAGKPKLGLWMTVFGGITNIVLDYVFMVPLNMGIAGAALATGIGMAIPAVFGVLYFWFSHKTPLYFVKPKCDIKMLLESAANGSSEMVSNLSVAVTTLLFNIIMMRYLGEDGVAAITIILYSQYLLTAAYLGFSAAVSPIISYNYGENNTEELKKLYKIGLHTLIWSSLVTFVMSYLLSTPIVSIFAQQGSHVFELAKHGFTLFSSAYLFMGANIFASAFFTALSNGKVSAIISFLRTFVFICLSIIILPPLLGVDGIWLSVPLAEVLSLSVSAAYVLHNKKVYNYA